jgi:formiminoglutamase
LDSLFEEICLLGYPDDEGIRLNGGRAGAAEAPFKVREIFYKMTPSTFLSKTLGVADLGNIPAGSLSLAEKHTLAKSITKKVFSLGKKLLTLGGGHDYGYADGSSFIEHFAKQKPIIFNFDAHLDVRPTDRGLTSGTPFYRLLTEYPSQFDLVEVGIQPQCNSRHHLRWAEEQGVAIVSLEEIQSKGLLTALSPWLVHDHRPCFLSVDIDGFQSSEAPGCSQSWTTGIKSSEFLDVLTKLSLNFRLAGMGIYEVSPILDHDIRTSKLAALLMHYFLHL